MAGSKHLFKVTGDEKIIKALLTLGPKALKQVAKPAANRAAKKFEAAIKPNTPYRFGAMRKSVRVRVAKGPRAFSGRMVVAFATIVGQARPTKSQARKGTRIPFYTFMQEKGFHTGGKRIRQGGKVIGYKSTTRAGSGGVRFIQGKFFIKHAMKSNEGPIRAAMLQEIYQGIDQLIARGSA